MDITESIDVERVASLLRDSHVSHAAATSARKAGDKVTAHAAITECLLLRERAHALDPAHTAPAWAMEQDRTPRGKDTHDELVAFYRQQMALAAFVVNP